MIRIPSVTSTTGLVPNSARDRNPPKRSKPALLNAVIEWNRPNHADWPASRPDARNAANRTTAPAASTTTVNNPIRRTIESTPPSSSPPVDAWARTRSRSPIRPPTNSSSRSVEPVMKPKPPTWTSPRITTWPNGLHAVAVSTTTRPVTQTADVAVKNAVDEVGRLTAERDTGKGAATASRSR